MGKKYSDEEIIDFIENDCNEWFQLKVLNFIDKDNILIQDNDGYKYLTSYAVIRNAKKRKTTLSKFFRNNPYTIENIKDFLINNHIEYTLVSENINNAKENVTWNCKVHGNFEMSWNQIKNGSGCPKCAIQKRANKTRNSYKYIKYKFEEKDLILVSKTYKNNESPLDFICKKHIDEGVQQVSFGNLLTKECVCTYCNKEKYRNIAMKSHNQFVKEISCIHGDKYKILGEYKGTNKHIKIKCNKCGHIWSTRPSHLLSGHGCPVCKSKSKGENLIRYYLQNHNINFKEEYRIKECRYKKPLPFDFAIFNNKNKLLCLIEFDGKQHFKPFGFGEKSEKKINKNFKFQQIRDDIKNNYCDKNNISLIRIPYWEIANIENILNARLINILKSNR